MFFFPSVCNIFLFSASLTEDEGKTESEPSLTPLCPEQPFPLAAEVSISLVLSLFTTLWMFQVWRSACGKGEAYAKSMHMRPWCCFFCCVQGLTWKALIFTLVGASPTEISLFCWHWRGWQVLTGVICTKTGRQCCQKTLLCEEWLSPRDSIGKIMLRS